VQLFMLTAKAYSFIGSISVFLFLPILGRGFTKPFYSGRCRYPNRPFPRYTRLSSIDDVYRNSHYYTCINILSLILGGSEVEN
jgi:hypothetical protein